MYPVPRASRAFWKPLTACAAACAVALSVAGCGSSEPMDEATIAQLITQKRKEADRQFGLFRQSSEDPRGVDIDALKRYVELHGETTKLAPDTCPLCYQRYGDALHRLGLYYRTLVEALEEEAKRTADPEEQADLKERAEKARKEMLNAFRSSTLQLENYFNLCRLMGQPVDPLMYYGVVLNSENVRDYNRALYYLDLYMANTDLTEDDQRRAKELRKEYLRERNRLAEDRLREELDIQ